MTFRLRDDLHFCVAGERVILLDPVGGNYQALTQEQTPAFRRWAMGNALVGSDRQRLQELEARNVLVASKFDDPPMALTSARGVVAEAAPDVTSETAPVRTVIAAVAAQLVWSRRVRYWPLGRLLTRLSNRSPHGDHKPLSAVAIKRNVIVRGFATADMLLGSHDRCLVRSLALAAVFRRQGLSSTLVIGVQPNPFAAHCWVQDGSMVLNDKPDRVQMFAPILTV